MNSYDLISIIVPIYNAEKYLNKCIESLLFQTYPNIEIILINDGSTDDSISICQDYLKKYKQIKLISQVNGGASLARNRGIKEANGKYIGFVDSDDFIEKDMYEILYKNIIKTKSQISICGRIIEENRKIIFKSKKGINFQMNTEEAILELNSLKSFDMSPCDKLYEKELINNIDFPIGTNSEDFYWMYKVMFNCKKICYCSDPLYHYCRRPNSNSRDFLNESYLLASKSQIDFFENKNYKLYCCAKAFDSYACTIQYNKYIVNNIKCSKLKKRELKKRARNNFDCVLFNSKFNIYRKMQIFVFCYFTVLYKIIIKIKNR